MSFHDQNIKKQKIIIIAVMAFLFAAFAAVGVIVGIPLVESASNPEHFRLWIDSLGLLGDFAYMALVVLQVVVAIIPGEPVEILGGYAFGAWHGTMLYLLGAFIGSLIVFLFVRKFGKVAADVFFSKEKLDSLKFLHSSPKRAIIFSIIFTVPGTPKDLLCYFAGLTRIKLSHFIFISAVARIPSVVTSSIGGSMLGQQKYVTAVIAFAVTILISLIGLLIYKMIEKRKNS
jgi:uncharacterized membrane protein YdjX (TVP38/TMEM64 family)